MKIKSSQNTLTRIILSTAFVVTLSLGASAHEESGESPKAEGQASAACCGKCQASKKANKSGIITRSRKSLFASDVEITPKSEICPIPVPAYVGHTTITYGPFMPQHLLYPHVDTYRQSYDDGRGLHRTRAAYRISLQSRMRNFQWNFLRLPR